MGLALCHCFPRDPVLRVSLLLLFISFIMQLILLVSYKTDWRSFSVYLNGKNAAPTPTAYIGSHEVVYAGNGTRICGFFENVEMVSVGCARFVEGFHAVSGLILLSFVFSFLVLVFISFCLVPLSKTTTAMLIVTFVVFLFPVALHTAAIGIFFFSCVKNLKDVAKRTVADYSTTVDSLETLANLAIASEVCLCVALISTLCRALFAIVFRRSVKQQDIENRNIGRLMQLHLVNDDWERQKEVLQTHSRNVRLEMIAHYENRKALEHCNGISSPLGKTLSQEREREFDLKPSCVSLMTSNDVEGASAARVNNEPLTQRKP